MKDKKHVEMRNNVEKILDGGLSIEEVAGKLLIPLGAINIKGSAKWYKYCIDAKEKQKKAIEKHPNLYSEAGKIAQKKHPWIGEKLGKKYGPIQGKINVERLRGNSEYFSKMAKRLQEVNPNQSSLNMKKAHETMKLKGNFNQHQKEAALMCRIKNPNQVKEMSKKAHENYPLALLALESRRKNFPYEFMDCSFDSNDERIICKKLVEIGLIERPIEKSNIHFRVNKCHIDFFIQNKLFLEYHPPVKRGIKSETNESYYLERRKLLDDNGFKDYPLIVISNLKEADKKIEETNSLLSSKTENAKDL
jgi:hypothetical protein